MAITNLAKQGLGLKPFAFLARISNSLPSFLERMLTSKKRYQASEKIAQDAVPYKKVKGVYVDSEGRRPMIERIREAKRQGIALKITQGYNPTLQRYLDNTPLDLCRNDEWENMRDVGKEIVD